MLSLDLFGFDDHNVLPSKRRSPRDAVSEVDINILSPRTALGVNIICPSTKRQTPQSTPITTGKFLQKGVSVVEDHCVSAHLVEHSSRSRYDRDCYVRMRVFTSEEN